MLRITQTHSHEIKITARRHRWLNVPRLIWKQITKIIALIHNITLIRWRLCFCNWSNASLQIRWFQHSLFCLHFLFFAWYTMWLITNYSLIYGKKKVNNCFSTDTLSIGTFMERVGKTLTSEIIIRSRNNLGRYNQIFMITTDYIKNILKYLLKWIPKMMAPKNIYHLI